MAGFFSLFDGNTTVDLGNNYSATIRKYLSEDDFSAASDALTPGKRIAASGLESGVDTTSYNRILVLRSLVSWTLDDEQGNILPITIDVLRKIPHVTFKVLLDAVNKNNEESGESPQEQATFPNENEGSAAGSK